MTSKYSLHCVWRQATPLKVPGKGKLVTCPIPDALMNNVRSMAHDNPDVPVTIWVDIYGLGKNSNRLMNALTDQVPESNITFKALDKIPAYRKHPLYKKPFDGFDHYGANIWEQVDLARLHVIHNALKHSGEGAVIYADMDIDFMHQSFKTAVDTLKETGTVVALEDKPPYPGIENEFFGFTQQSLRFLENVLLKKAEEMAGQDIGTGNGDQYVAFMTAFDPEHAASYGVSRQESGVIMHEIPNAREVKDAYQKPRP